MTQDWSFCLFTHSHDVHCPARNDLFMPRFLIVDENNYYPSLRPGQSLSIQRLTSPSLSTHCLLISSLSTLSSAASSPLSEWSWPRLRAGVEQCWAGSHNPYYLQPFKDLFILCLSNRSSFFCVLIWCLTEFPSVTIARCLTAGSWCLCEENNYLCNIQMLGCQISNAWHPGPCVLCLFEGRRAQVIIRGSR